MTQLEARIRDLDDPRRRLTTELYPPPPHKLWIYGRRNAYQIEDSPNWTGDSPPSLLSESINTVVQDLSVTDMCFGASNVRVWRLSANLPSAMTAAHTLMIPPAMIGMGLQIAFFAFREYYSEFPISVPIMVPENYSTNHDGILVGDRGEWKRLKDWLLALPDRQWLLERYPWAARDTQQEWWASNGKVFEMMKLPLELRRAIYREALSGELYASNRDSKLVLVQRDYGEHYGHLFQQWYNPKFREITRFPLLCASLEIRKEVMEAIWPATRKVFDDPRTFYPIISAMPPADFINSCLTKIELSFSIVDWCHFVGLERRHGFYSIDRSGCIASFLKMVPALKEVTMRFPDPYLGDTSRYPGPWNTGMDDEGRRAFPACYKVIVNMILNLVLPWLKGVRKVHITGCIKTVTKKKFDSLFALCCSHENYLNDDFWHSMLELGKPIRVEPGDNGTQWVYDRREEMNSFFWLNPLRLPKCRCPNSCYKYSRKHGIDVFDPDDEWRQTLWDPCMLFADANDRWPVLFGPFKDDLAPFERMLDEAEEEDMEETESEDWLQDRRHLPVSWGSRITVRMLERLTERGQNRLCNRSFGDRIERDVLDSRYYKW